MSGLIRAPVLSPRARWWLLAAALLILVVVSSGGGLRNGFTYDDVYIIQLNGIVHSLHEWWRLFTYSYWPRLYGSDGYRPLTMLAAPIRSSSPAVGGLPGGFGAKMAPGSPCSLTRITASGWCSCRTASR